MTLLRRTATTLAALALAAVVTPLATAHAQDTTWKTLVTVNGARPRPARCPSRPPVPGRSARVDASKASGRVNGSAYITKDGNVTSQSWKSGWVAPGKVTPFGKVTLPAGEKYAMDAGLGTGAMGNGGTFTASNLPRC